MMRKGTIIMVDDDADDLYIFKDIVEELGIRNPVECFEDAASCFNYLQNSKQEILIIFSDINMPGIDGMEFKRRINSNPEIAGQHIPFIFYSTAASKENVREAFEALRVNGFFVKNPMYTEVKNLMAHIINYWSQTRYLDVAG
ncbi:MAG: response regulator [Bacteroidia bacterium]